MGIDGVKSVRVVETGKEVKGHDGIFRKEELQILEFPKEIQLKALREAIKGNNLDEIIIETADGGKLAIYADELDNMPEVGDTLEIGDIRGRVVLVDNEWNEEAVAIGSAALVIGAVGFVGGVAAGAFAGKSLLYGSAMGAQGAAGAATSVGVIGKVTGAFKEDPALLRALAKPKT